MFFFILTGYFLSFLFSVTSSGNPTSDLSQHYFRSSQPDIGNRWLILYQIWTPILEIKVFASCYLHVQDVFLYGFFSACVVQTLSSTESSLLTVLLGHTTTYEAHGISATGIINPKDWGSRVNKYVNFDYENGWGKTGLECNFHRSVAFHPVLDLDLVRP